MTTVRLEIAYDGAEFRGWAAQPGLRTVQGELEAALAQILPEPATLTVAGRTDAGVHAWRQVASFSTGAAVPDELERRLNGLTGPDLAVLEAASVAEGFDARRDALSRTYCYRVLARRVPDPFERGRALHWRLPLELEPMNECAAAALGRHDFTAFTPTETDHVFFDRTLLRCEWARESEAVLALWVEANAFMHNMVRILVGTMLEVGSGRRSVDDFAALLNGAPRERAGETAAAHGLYLAGVSFSEAG